MPSAQLNREAIYLKALEGSLRFHTSKLKRLQRFWIPLQEHAPKWMLALLGGSVSISLATHSYYHWWIVTPTMVVLIIVEMIVEELHMNTLLIMDEKRHLLRDAQHSYAQYFRKVNSNFMPRWLLGVNHRYCPKRYFDDQYIHNFE